MGPAARATSTHRTRLPQSPPPAPEQPCQPQQFTRVELVRVVRSPPPGPVGAQPPAEPAAQPAAAIAEPDAPPVPSAPPPKPKKKYKKRPRRERPLKPRGRIRPRAERRSRPSWLTTNGSAWSAGIPSAKPSRKSSFTGTTSTISPTHYQIDARTIYRHARAVNLYDKRDRNLRFALGHIIHRAQSVRITADPVIRAVHHFARINRDGHWVNPPTHIIVSSGSRIPAPLPDPPPADAIDVALPGDESPALIDTEDE